MREFKFRAWHTMLHKMFYDISVASESWSSKDTHRGGNHSTVMQFTGLHDKNGKEIFEGDIISSVDTKFEIQWNQEKAMYYCLIIGSDVLYCPASDSYIQCNFEIIGNIFENKELLGQDHV